MTLGHSGNLAWGSFLTATGGYRFLGGQIINEKEMKLSAFNGNQAFFFTANKQLNGTLKGNFYSSKSGYETFTAVLDPTAKLPKR